MASTIEEAIYAKLVATSAVTALVSTRITPGLALTDDQVQRLQMADSWPQIVYAKQDDTPWVYLAGVSKTSRALIRMQCWGDTYADAKSVRAVVRAALNGIQETITPTGGTAVYIRAMIVEDDPDLIEISPENAQRRYYGAALLARVIYRET